MGGGWLGDRKTPRKKVNFARTEGIEMKDGPHNLFLGEPEVVHESFVRLVPQEITIM